MISNAFLRYQTDYFHFGASFVVLYNASSCGFLDGMISNQSCECSCKVLSKWVLTVVAF